MPEHAARLSYATRHRLVSALQVRQQQEVQNFFRLPPGQMPQFMMQPYLQDVEFLNGLKDIVARKWKPPTEVGSGDDEVDALQVCPLVVGRWSFVGRRLRTR